MCGIVGFTGAAQAAPILLDGLSKLEYRGYDSAGIAVQEKNGKIEVVKAKNEEAAKAFLDYLTGEQASAVFEGVGFSPVK